MPSTMNGYGSINSPVVVCTGTTEILPALTKSRYEIDGYKIRVISLDAGATIKLGFTTAANAPEIFYTDSSMTQEYTHEFPSPGYGLGSVSTTNQPVQLVFAGGGGEVHVTVAYHIVPMVYPVTPS